MAIIPTQDRVVVKVKETEDQTKGGIILPDNYKEEKAEGTIISVGPGKVLDNGQRKHVRLSPGQHVVFGKWAGEDVKIEDTTYKIVRENDVLAVLNKP